jgi:hypothetical protein
MQTEAAASVRSQESMFCSPHSVSSPPAHDCFLYPRFEARQFNIGTKIFSLLVLREDILLLG